MKSWDAWKLLALPLRWQTMSAREAAAAKALITALTAPSAAPIYNAKGLDPAW
jgi:hypothetical protein